MGRLCSGGLRFDRENVIFAAYFILRDRDMHIQLSAVIVSGRHDLPSDAITFYLRSFETQSSSLRQKKLISQAPEDRKNCLHVFIQTACYVPTKKAMLIKPVNSQCSRQ